MFTLKMPTQKRDGRGTLPLPWTSLAYDTQLEGYRVGATEDLLKGTPKFSRSNDWDWENRAHDRGAIVY
jgi:hypothetical protein